MPIDAISAIFAVAALVLLSLYVIYKPPGLIFSYFERRWPAVLWRVHTAVRVIALTIDDAPSSNTLEIADTLAAYDAKATFFVIGSNMVGRESLLHSLVREGHELGNHAMEDEASRSLPVTVLKDQLQIVQRRIDDTYAAVGRGPPPKYFRPGHAWFSGPMRTLLHTTGFRLVLGNVYPHDPQIPFARLNACHILSMVAPGAIVVCHDGRDWTAPMLRLVLPELKKRNYRVVTLTELLTFS